MPPSMAIHSDLGITPSASRTPSVVSRPLHHRSKRGNRSIVSSANYVPQNEFPIFENSGDVEIIITVGRTGYHTRRYLLHKHTLSCCSGFFEVSLSPEWDRYGAGRIAAPVNATSSGLGTGTPPGSESGSPHHYVIKRWCYELEPPASDTGVPMLVQRDSAVPPPSIFGPNQPSSSTYQGRPAPVSGGGAGSFYGAISAAQSTANFWRGVTGRLESRGQSLAEKLSDRDEDLLRDYDNMFRIFYNYPPIIDGVSIADAYVQCKSLLVLADQYNALDVVGPRVDHHLLQFQWRLWKQIAKYPISYLRLGLMARSKVIFQEALIHVVGQWPSGERNLRQSLPAHVMEIIEDKVADLEEKVARVEGQLFRTTKYGRDGQMVTPQSSLLDWLAVSFFRQWLVTETTAAQAAAAQAAADPRRSKGTVVAKTPMVSPLQYTGKVYRTIGSSSSNTYLGHDECKRFLKLMPELYSRDNLKRFERSLDELKGVARELVRPLMGSELELEGVAGAGGHGHGEGKGVGEIRYLTCTTVGDRDIPWPVES